MKPFELIIFDCDGVLVDTERIAARIGAEALAGLGWHLSGAQVAEKFLGLSLEDSQRAVEAHLGYALPKDWAQSFEPLYERAFRSELRPVDGIVEALDHIAVPTCVASSGSHAKMRFTLGLVGLYERFAGRIFSASEVERGKPAPDLFLYAAERLGVPPQACAVIEDSRNGTIAAVAAGMRVFGYSGGLTPAADLERAGATVFSDMRRLPGILQSVRDESVEVTQGLRS